MRGQSYPVSIAGYSVGTITFLNPTPTAFANITNEGHIFFYGSVAGNIIGNQSYGFVGRIYGSGMNQSYEGIPAPVMAWINQESGPQVFAVQLQAVNLELLSICGG